MEEKNTPIEAGKEVLLQHLRALQELTVEKFAPDYLLNLTQAIIMVCRELRDLEN